MSEEQKEETYTKKDMRIMTRTSIATALFCMYLVSQGGREETQKYEGIAKTVLTPVVTEVIGQQTKPGDLEIRIEDLDKDGQEETIIKVQGQEYLMRIGADGKTQLLKYRIETKPYVPAIPAIPATKKIVTEQDPGYEVQK